MDSESKNINIDMNNYKKIMKAHLRKINRKKNRLQGKKKNTENSTSDLSSNSELKNSSNLSRKMDVLAEELFLSKKLERTLKNEIGMLELQIQKNQSEIADLKQIIEDTEDQKTKQKTKYEKEVADLQQFVEQIRGKFNENEQLNLG